MNFKINETIEILKELKANNPDVNFTALELSLYEAKVESDSIFYSLNKEDLECCYDELAEDTLLEDVSKEIKDEFIDVLHQNLVSKFYIDDWTEAVKGWISDSIEKDYGYYVCKDINPDWVDKWHRYKEITKTIDTSFKSKETIENAFQIEKLNDAVLICVDVFFVEGISDELDTALDEVRSFERNGLISYEQYEAICDLWFN